MTRSTPYPRPKGLLWIHYILCRRPAIRPGAGKEASLPCVLLTSSLCSPQTLLARGCFLRLGPKFSGQSLPGSEGAPRQRVNGYGRSIWPPAGRPARIGKKYGCRGGGMRV